MNESDQATALANWLEEHPGQRPPPDVDGDVLEALYALRPDLAPAPRLTIDDILGGLSAGPLAPVSAEEVEDAARLAGWLDGEGDGAEDEDVRASLFALRPDLAPAPAFDLDALVADLRAGPLADRGGGAPVPEDDADDPDGASDANVVALAPRRKPWAWAGPGVGALLVAALALVWVVPVKDEEPAGFPAPQSSSESAPASSIPEMEEPVAAADRPEAKTLRAGGDSGVDRQTGDATVAGPAPGSPDRAASTRKDQASSYGDGGLRDAAPDADPSPVGGAGGWWQGADDGSAGGTIAAERTGAPIAESAGAASAGRSAPVSPPEPDYARREADNKERRPTTGYTASTEDAEDEAGAGEVVALGRESPAQLEREDRLRQQVDSRAPRPLKKAEAPKTSSRPSRELAPAEEAAYAEYDADDDADGVADMIALDEAPAGSAATTTATTTPTDPLLDTRFAAAEADRAAGRTATALATLLPLIDAPNPAIAMEAALRAARIQRDTGDLEGALRTVSRGLAKGPVPSDLRQQLAALQAALRGAALEAPAASPPLMTEPAY